MINLKNKHSGTLHSSCCCCVKSPNTPTYLWIFPVTRGLNAFVFCICQKEKYLTPKIPPGPSFIIIIIIIFISLQHKVDILGEKDIFLSIFML